MALRSTFAGINTMYRGISTNRVSLETVGHNLTNATTPGYSRQSVNQGAVQPDHFDANGARQYVGAGVDSLSITRARDAYADKQYWRENSTLAYHTVTQKNYDKLEVIFDDSDNNGIQAALTDFYRSWVDMSKEASTTSERVAVLEKGKILTESVQTAAKQLQEQINAQYQELVSSVTEVNTITEQLVTLNQTIMAAESSCGDANDLRDTRDSLIDRLSEYASVTVTEDANGMYTVVSNGVSLVNGISRLTLTVGPHNPNGSIGQANEDYGITDYELQIKGTDVRFDPLSGKMAAYIDTVETNKEYIDDLADIASFLLTNFNTQHQHGIGMDSPERTTGLNFFGRNDTLYKYVYDAGSGQKSVTADRYTGGIETTVTLGKDDEGFVDIKYEPSGKGAKIGTTDVLRAYRLINTLQINDALTATDGERLIAAAAWAFDYRESPDHKGNCDYDPVSGKYVVNDTKTGKYFAEIEKNGTADGEVAVLLSKLINQGKSGRKVETVGENGASIGESSLVNFYNNNMTDLGVNTAACKNIVERQEDVIDQVTQWRASTAGVNWDEELSNMIMFQTGYSACSRCLTTIDEMLDRLINSTGMVGR